jgi:exodeoxyribonuclease V beta subunit
MALPKWKETLEISPVRSAPGKEDRSFGDERGSVHFFVAQGAHTHKHWPSETIELEQLFPFIAAEIAQLVRLKGLKLSSFAILVKDRYQALRLQNYLKQWQIAAVTLKSRSLLDSVAFGALLPHSRCFGRRALSLAAWPDRRLERSYLRAARRRALLPVA